MGVDIHSILAGLARKRPVFHSEADFQHALAWELHATRPRATVRLEFPISPGRASKTLHIDILLNKTCAIELKYKTVECEHSLRGEHFSPKSHGAQLLGRYDFVADIARLEQLVRSGPCTEGYAIILTNDRQYWNCKEADVQTLDRDFRIHEGATIGGMLRWANPDLRYLGARKAGIELRGKYALLWRDYCSRLNFRYLAVKVTSS